VSESLELDVSQRLAAAHGDKLAALREAHEAQLKLQQQVGRAGAHWSPQAGRRCACARQRPLAGGACVAWLGAPARQACCAC
jgi:hypothetical protein